MKPKKFALLFVIFLILAVVLLAMQKDQKPENTETLEKTLFGNNAQIIKGKIKKVSVFEKDYFGFTLDKSDNFYYLDTHCCEVYFSLESADQAPKKFNNYSGLLKVDNQISISINSHKDLPDGILVTNGTIIVN